MIVFLTTADTEILALSYAARDLPAGFPAVRAANPAALQAPADLAAFLDAAAAARVVVVRLLGGRRAFEPGFAELQARCQAAGVPLIACPGDQQPDLDLAAACTAPAEIVQTVFSYLLHGGVANLRGLLCYLADRLMGQPGTYDPPRELPWEGLYHPDQPDGVDLDAYLAAHVRPERPTLGLLFYRAHWMSGNLAFVDALIRAAEAADVNVLPVYCYSLKDETAEAAGTPRVFRRFLLDEAGRPRVDVVVNTLSFSMGKVAVQGPSLATGWSVDFLDRLNVPILQAVIATSSRAQWQAAAGGSEPDRHRDERGLPEFDGRIVTRADQLQGDHRPTIRCSARPSSATCPPPTAWTTSSAWPRAGRGCAARRTPRSASPSSWPTTRRGTRGWATPSGLDTPASVINVLHALAADGYRVEDIPETGDALMHTLIDRCTYDEEFLTADQVAQAGGPRARPPIRRLVHAGFPAAVRQELAASWGAPPGSVYCYDDALMIPGLALGNVFVGIQPPRGFGENPIAIYHSPDLPPTHHYLAYYRWLRDDWGAARDRPRGQARHPGVAPRARPPACRRSATPRSC